MTSYGHTAGNQDSCLSLLWSIACDPRCGVGATYVLISLQFSFLQEGVSFSPNLALDLIIFTFVIG